uniref:Uncharacterized protein n=1 Tax=Canis lupus dingo TaxID=286419 RepID=A0A8C0JVZ1_CANLU
KKKKVGSLRPRFSARRAHPPTPPGPHDDVGSLSFPGCATDLQMWARGIQQRMSPLSCCHQ